MFKPIKSTQQTSEVQYWVIVNDLQFAISPLKVEIQEQNWWLFSQQFSIIMTMYWGKMKNKVSDNSRGECKGARSSLLSASEINTTKNSQEHVHIPIIMSY